jgi:hypothetical protein
MRKAMSSANSATASVSAKPRMPIGKTAGDQRGEDVADAKANAGQGDDGETGPEGLRGENVHGERSFPCPLG